MKIRNEMKELKRKIDKRYRNIMGKIFWSRGGISFACKYYMLHWLRGEETSWNYLGERLEDYFAPVIDKYLRSEDSSAAPSKKQAVWTMWWQGEAEMPEVVRICIASMRRQFEPWGIPVILLTKENINQYLEIPPYIKEKTENGKFSLVFFSEWARYKLLATYGGIWMDSTIYCAQGGESGCFQNKYYSIRALSAKRFTISGERWSTYFFAAYANTKLFCFIAEAYEYYMEKETVQVHYFLCDSMIRIAYDTFPQIRKDIDAIPPNNKDRHEMMKILNEAFDQEKFDQWRRSTHYFKLTYRYGHLQEYTKDKKITYYGALMKEYRDSVRENTN